MRTFASEGAEGSPDKGERYYEDKDVYGATIDDVDMELVSEYVNVIGYGKSGMEYLRETMTLSPKKMVSRRSAPPASSSSERILSVSSRVPAPASSATRALRRKSAQR